MRLGSVLPNLPVPRGVAPTPPRLGVGLRLRVLLHRGRLDDQLRLGIDPVRSRELALRAGQLVGPRSRKLLCRGLERAMRVVEHPNSALASAAIVPDHTAVRTN